MTTGIGTGVLAVGTRVNVLDSESPFVEDGLSGTISPWTAEYLAEDASLSQGEIEDAAGQHYFDDFLVTTLMGGPLYIVHMDALEDGTFPTCSECTDDHRQIGLTEAEFEVTT